MPWLNNGALKPRLKNNYDLFKKPDLGKVLEDIFVSE